MCFSSFASFSFGTGLVGVGLLCSGKAIKSDLRYLPLAIMPLAVGIQQIAEGMIWRGFENYDTSMITSYAFVYLFFLWMFWPRWAGFSAAMLEPEKSRRYVFLGFALTGLALGASVYIPYIWHPDWMHVAVKRLSIAYTNECMLTDQIVPRNMVHAFYLFVVCAPLLLSSHSNLRFFGATLLIFVPIAFFMFSYAFASVLCFFAALSCLHILYIVMSDKCADPNLERLARIEDSKDNAAPV